MSLATSSFETLALGAFLGIAGCVAGQLLMRLPARALSRREVEVAARELAMSAVLSLEEFVSDCFETARDDPQFNPEDPQEFLFNSPDPSPFLPRNADWTLMTNSIADEIRWMPLRAQNIIDGLQAIDIEMPNYGDLFEKRQRDFSKLGLAALDLIDRLCAEYSISEPDRPDYYDPRKEFLSKVKDIEERLARLSKNNDTGKANLSNVTPLFPPISIDEGQS